MPNHETILPNFFDWMYSFLCSYKYLFILG